MSANSFSLSADCSAIYCIHRIQQHSNANIVGDNITHYSSFTIAPKTIKSSKVASVSNATESTSKCRNSTNA